MSSIIDIHPHIVSPDTKTLSAAIRSAARSPPGRRERPTTYHDTARGDGRRRRRQGGDRAFLDRLRLRQQLRRRCGRRRAVALHRRLFDRRAGARRREDIRCTGSAAAAPACACSPPAARCRIRPPGSPIRKTYPFWEHAAAKNIPVCMQMKQEGFPLLRQIMDRFPKVTIILDHLSRTPFEDGPPYAGAADFLALAKYKQVYLKITPINVTPKTLGQGHAGDVLRQGDRHVRRRSRIAWGSNFPNSIGTLKEILGAAQQGVFVRQVDAIRIGSSARPRSRSIRA